MSKKIGILGSGGVAKALAKGFVQHGYSVMLGSRDTQKLNDWLHTSGLKAAIGSFEEAAQYGELLVLAVKGHAAVDVLKLAGLQNFTGKTVIDTNNPISENVPPTNGVLHFFTGPNDSLMEHLQKAAPEAHFVKAFSCVGNIMMVNPIYKQGTPTMFICGNHESAKDEVKAILEQFGWDVCDMGKMEAARAIEPLCMLWCIPGFVHNSWGHALKLYPTGS